MRVQHFLDCSNIFLIFRSSLLYPSMKIRPKQLNTMENRRRKCNPVVYQEKLWFDHKIHHHPPFVNQSAPYLNIYLGTFAEFVLLKLLQTNQSAWVFRTKLKHYVCLEALLYNIYILNIQGSLV